LEKERKRKKGEKKGNHGVLSTSLVATHTLLPTCTEGQKRLRKKEKKKSCTERERRRGDVCHGRQLQAFPPPIDRYQVLKEKLKRGKRKKKKEEKR